ncbi:glycoside hydrolase family 30 beta sandwich domain-containing protein [Aquabacterium sp. OR-4]|uniref:glycoside hydrolase family 30 beta sandwich domain-containing protein n=1 Tax=Aquabacterium sp. OR-4 TaxID=2978127 RepID=UPI0021B45954|nr:glycoside hydrolase family 30 beta sandwich domain-containing protein [Aquabacterium sp. OR-4]MDT7838615.1 glycoside hydrolase family 30 beta sandwich domain-containing protein [Aquabacterium sp. OR-4]
MTRRRTLSALCALFTGLGLLGATAQSSAQTINIDPGTVHQLIRGFGGHNGAGWINDLTPAEVDTAFGTESGQVGLSIMRMRIDSNSAKWATQLPTAQRAKAKGVTLFATPWSPPAAWKSNNSLNNGGTLLPENYGKYADHLLSFANYMSSGNAALHAISLANEPDYTPTYESCNWTAAQLVSFLQAHGSKFGSLKVIAPESFNFKKSLSDPILNDSVAVQHLDIVGGHLYGPTPSDYPLARAKRKEVWMTEHFTDNVDANNWTSAMPVARELHRAMVANYNAYVWWYIRRSYGLITDDGRISKRGSIMAQYARYIRPGYVRIAATENPHTDVFVTAYRNSAGKLVVVATNTGTSQRRIVLNLLGGTVTSFSKTRTSASYSNEAAGTYAVVDGQATAYIDPGSVNTFVSQ